MGRSRFCPACILPQWMLCSGIAGPAGNRRNAKASYKYGGFAQSNVLSIMASAEQAGITDQPSRHYANRRQYAIAYPPKPVSQLRGAAPPSAIACNGTGRPLVAFSLTAARTTAYSERRSQVQGRATSTRLAPEASVAIARDVIDWQKYCPDQAAMAAQLQYPRSSVVSDLFQIPDTNYRDVIRPCWYFQQRGITASLVVAVPCRPVTGRWPAAAHCFAVQMCVQARTRRPIAACHCTSTHSGMTAITGLW